MSIKRVASRYAKSLIDLAVEQNRLERIKEDVEAIQKLIRESKDFVNFLKSPVIQHSRKRSILEAMFSGKLDELTLKFMIILTTKQREAYMVDIAGEFMDQYRAIKHISVVRIISASELTSQQLSDLQKKIEASKVGFEHVEFVVKVDPSLVGGFIVEVDDMVYDTTLKHQLANLKKEFTTNLYESKIVAR